MFDVMARGRGMDLLQDRALGGHTQKNRPEGRLKSRIARDGEVGWALLIEKSRCGWIIAPTGARQSSQPHVPNPSLLVAPTHRGTGSSQTGKPHPVAQGQVGSISL